MNKPNFRGYNPKIEINSPETLAKALSVGRELEILMTSAEYNSLGLNFFSQFVRPDQLYLLATNHNIDQIVDIVNGGDLDELLDYIANECMGEFENDAQLDPMDRQFPDQTLEFLELYKQGAVPVEA